MASNITLGTNALGGTPPSSGADGNIAIGDDTGVNAGVNSYAVLVGHEAGKNSAGAGQVAVGAYALHNGSNAFYNIAIGLETLRYLTTGLYNTVIGWGSAIGLTSGSHNVGVGHDVLKTATTASRNVAVGKEAMYNTNANDAIGVGYQAGYDSGNNSIAIGNQAGKGTNRANTLFIGNGTAPHILAHMDTNRTVIGGGTTEGGVALLINSTNGGLRVPRLTNTQEAAIAPSAGTIIYNTDMAKLRVQSEGVWKSVAFE